MYPNKYYEFTWKCEHCGQVNIDDTITQNDCHINCDYVYYSARCWKCKTPKLVAIPMSVVKAQDIIEKRIEKWKKDNL